jgi:hypothetical protein
VPVLDGPIAFTEQRLYTAAGNVSLLNEATLIVKKSVGGPTQVMLPPTPTLGREIRVIDGKGDAATNNITVVPRAGTINGGTTYIINSAYGAATFYYSGLEWLVLNPTAGVAVGGSLIPTNRETLTTTKILADSDVWLQELTPSGADQTVALPASPTINRSFRILNSGAGLFGLNVNAGVSTLYTLRGGEWAEFVWTGSVWRTYLGAQAV